MEGGGLHGHKDGGDGWIDSWAHSDQYGAKAGRSLLTTVQKVYKAREKGHCPLSLDLGKCFDRIAPAVALGTLAALGASRQLTGMLSHVWYNQKRWLVIGRSAAPEPRRTPS